jgi:hypothetical protein
MNRTTLSAIAVALAAPMLVASVQAASAAVPSKGHLGQRLSHAQPSSKIPATPLGALKGYQQVSASFTDTAAAQTEGVVGCPSGTVAVGGGAVISGFSLAENLNASVPFSDGSGWVVYVNNASGTSGTFTVYAVCATNIVNYSVILGTGVDNPSGFQAEATVACPHGSAPLGGGGIASSGDTAVNLNSSFPLKKGWRADANNGSAGGDTIAAYVVCGTKPKLYTQVVGTSVNNAAGSQTNAVASCPTGTSVMSGGVLSGSGSTLVNLNTSIPSGASAWSAYEDNSSGSDASLTPYAVCGKAKS